MEIPLKGLLHEESSAFCLVHDFGGKFSRVRWLMWISEAQFMFLITMSAGGVGLKHIVNSED